MAQRRAFRRLPPERLRMEDYWSADTTAADRTYSMQGAVIANYEFDRVAFRVVGSTFRSADPAHWLALDVAARALADAGFPDGQGLPRETTGVVLGNTLTGEFSRANVLRLRWPYVRRVVEAALQRESFPAESRRAFLEGLEAQYKSPFPPVGEETLAGGLSNTIAGRICNQFDLKGGGYTVDGACASSLLAVANACTALAGGDLDMALAGGVDLSLDPFELVGFAKTGALAPEEMRVFDRRSAGFWPGEGCGFVVLMRHEDALARGCPVYAVIRGWGVSSDGNGGLTRPEARGQIEALRRAYRRAGFGIDTVGYFEGHGTGTAVGDATELEVLSQARHEVRSDAPAAGIGSIKANIGHTKAAAGLAGLLKATMAVHTQVLPPTTGCEQPHALLCGPETTLRTLREPESWPEDRPLRAAVSAMGFGGINTHVVLESPTAVRRRAISMSEGILSRSPQDCELFLWAAATVTDLVQQIHKVIALADGLSCAEMTDLAAELERVLVAGPIRAAVVASKPAELAASLQTLRSWLQENEMPRSRFSQGVFLGSGTGPPRVALLFPGQGSPSHLDGGIWRRRFGAVRKLYAQAVLPAETDSVSTRVMQPAVVTASLAGLKVLEEFGLAGEAVWAIGHSLGELTALHWAGALTAEALLRIAQVRGAAMAALGSPTGGMLAIAAPAAEVERLFADAFDRQTLAIVGFNSPRQTVVAGEAMAIEALGQRVRAAGLQGTLLPVSHAFHTPLVAAAVPVLNQHLAREEFATFKRGVISTITGERLEGNEDLRVMLCRQVTSPVKFNGALVELLNGDAGGIDLLLEVGPGEVLTGLVREATDLPVIALDAGGPSLRGLLQALGAAYVVGAPVRHKALFGDRFIRPFTLDSKPKFFVNPCELAPVSAESRAHSEEPLARTQDAVVSDLSAPSDRSDLKPLELIRQLVAARAELPLAAVKDGSRMLSDLHLNSITVGQLVSEAARRLALPRVVGLTDFANASVAETARALEELKQGGASRRVDDGKRQPPGVDIWFESFTMELVEAARSGGAVGRTEGRIAGVREPRSPGEWRLFAPKGHALGQPLQAKLMELAGTGVLLCLPENPNEEHMELLLEAGRAATTMNGNGRFVLVQHGWGGAGFARTLHLETPGLTTCIVNVPPAHPQAIEWIVAEVVSATGYTEAHYDKEGRRWEPRLKWLSSVPSDSNISKHSGERIPFTPALSHGEREICSPAVRRPAVLPNSEELRRILPHPKGEGRGEGKKDVRARRTCEGISGTLLGADDVLLVSGGGKGIAAECALAVARATGVRLALLGRASPTGDKELAQNLARIAAAGVHCCYVRADVSDAAAVRAAVSEAEQKVGPITALLHGAGTNTPQLIAALDMAAFQRTLAPKLQGARNLLAALSPERLRLFVTFSSIIARAGLRGEADYATANEWLTVFTEQFQAQHPSCRCLALEWSIWSGVGMGERLGRVDALIQHGITPIPVDEGVRIFLEMLQRPVQAVSVVITGRFGEPPTLRLPKAELPLRRFLERKRVHYPGVELIVDAELSTTTDPYLEDHVLQKERLFPAVLGLEAMAQAAMALTGSNQPPSFEQVKLSRPIVVSGTTPTTIRLATLRRSPDLVEVCLRSEETDFHVDHFRALCRFGGEEGRVTDDDEGVGFGKTGEGSQPSPSLLATRHPPALRLDPQRDLYGRLLFHQGRFCRVRTYRVLTARECVAELAPPTAAPWFGPYLPNELVLGDPGARDAALHAIQACIPHQRILPTGIDRLTLCGSALRDRADTGARFVRARERLREGDNFVYDLEVFDETSAVVEVWEGLRLRAVQELASNDPWPEVLLGPYLERRLEELVAHSRARVAVKRNGKQNSAAGNHKRRQATDTVFRQALGATEVIWRRPDGKPVNAKLEGVSAAHAQDLMLVVADGAEVACDLEPVVARSEPMWRDLLGQDRFVLAGRIGRERTETADAAATRLWVAAECLKKAGCPPEAPLVLEAETPDGWVVLRSGRLAIATCVLAVRNLKSGLAVAVALHS